MKRTIGLVACLNNYDNDTNYWTSLNLNSYIIHDKDLNNADTIMMDTIPQNGYPDILDHKYNNKVYSVSYRYENNKDTNLVYFSSYDLNTGAFISKQIPTSFKVFRCYEIFTKNKEFAVLLSKMRTEPLTTGMLVDPQLIIIDTLGNVVRSKYISGIYQEYPLVEIGNYFVLRNRASYQRSNIMLINKNTLELQDSIDGEFLVAKAINDSILVGAYGGGYVDVNIWNINTKERKKYRYIADTVPSGPVAITFMMDFINPDSIYLVYRMISFFGPETDYCRIDNFGINGNFILDIPLMDLRMEKNIIWKVLLPLKMED